MPLLSHSRGFLATAFAVGALSFMEGTTAIRAQAATGEETLRDISKAWEGRDEQLNPIWVRFRLTFWQSEAWQKVRSREPVSGEIHWSDDGEYARKGVKTRSWVHRGRPSLSRPWDIEDFYIYNGEVQIQKNNAEDTYTIRKQPKDWYVAETPFDIAAEKLLKTDLRSWKAGEASKTSISESHGDGGERVVIVENHYPNGFWGKYFFLPDRGWAILRREAYNPQNGPMNFESVQEYGDAHGVVYPKRGRQESYLASGELGETLDFEIESIETQASRIPDSLFVFDIPKTANIWDDDLKVTVRNTEVAESHLKDVVARAGGHGGWAWWVWLSFAAGVVAIAAAAFWFFRRKRPTAPPKIAGPK